jgi:hypothetical protein
MTCKVAHGNKERPVPWPAASIKARVNLVRSLVSMTVERRVQPISVGRRSFPRSHARQQVNPIHPLKKH